MGEIAQNHRIGRKKGRSKKLSTRIDFTPMVDLGFLLITFFMLATNLNKPQTMEIALPSRDRVNQEDQAKVKASKAVTILLGRDNKVYYYEGTRENNTDPVLNQTDFSPSGLRKYLIQRNYEVVLKVRDLKLMKEKKKLTEEEYQEKRGQITRDKNAPIVLIKATDDSVYRNLIDVLDEMAICSIDRYAIADISPYDLDLISRVNPDKPTVNDAKK